MKLIVSFIIAICFCCSDLPSELNNAFSSVNNMKDKILIVNIADDSVFYAGGDNAFRNNLIRLVDKLKKNNPSVIFLNMSFLKKTTEEKFFVETLNKDLQTISTFIIDTSGIELNLTSSMRHWIGGSIPAQKKGSYEDAYTFTGVKFPSIEMIKGSKKICSYKFFLNNDNVIEYIHPFNQYQEYLFESCALTISNEILNNYGLNIKYNKQSDLFVLDSQWANYFGFVRYLEPDGHFRGWLPIEFNKFKELDASTILSDNFSVDEGSVLIINVNHEIFLTESGRKLNVSQILASEVYTILDRSSRKLTFYENFIRLIERF